MISVRAIVALYFTLVSSAFAADITAKSWEATGSNFSRLTISIIGPIEKGDAKKVAELVKNDGNQAFDDWHDRVAVLDSPGGSFEEAIALMKLFRKEAISTYVPENARCLSACALVFMAGTDTSVYFLTNNRVLHPKGQLGFHAPSLDFPNDIEVPGSSRLLNQTYASALRSIAQVVDQMEELVFEEGLLSEMLATPPNDMRIIKTVDDANRWKISLDVNPPTKIARREFGQLCVFFDSWNKGASVSYEQSYRVEARDIKSKSIRGGTVFYYKVNEENENTCYVKQTRPNDSNFEVFYSASAPDSVINSIATSNLSLDFATAQHLLLPQEEIRNLPSTSRRMQLPSDFNDPNTQKMFCEKFDGEQRVKASGCLKFVKDGKFQYRWDDGSLTVTENNGKLVLDGAEAGLVKLSKDRICWRNRETGATFCRSDEPIEYNRQQSQFSFATAPLNFSGGCRQGKRWSSQIYNETPRTVRVGLYHCVYLDEHEGQPPPLEFVCSPGDKKYVVRSAIEMPHTNGGQQVYFTIDNLGMTLAGRGEHNEMTGENDLEFKIPPYHELINSLAAGTSATIQAGRKKISLHLKDSRKALRYLDLCSTKSNRKASAKSTAQHSTAQQVSSGISRLVGIWTGIVAQPNAASRQNYRITLNIFEVAGNLKFSVDYPELDCKGVGALTSINGNEFNFSERISDGRARCIDGDFRMSLLTASQADWVWGAGVATAKLKRR